ncbi:MAG: restriction endonuclease [Roseiarcus sp.]
MAKAILTTKIDPTYDDLPEQRYHFPRTYLRAVEAARRDWIIYYEPRRSSGLLSSRGGRQSYFATACISEIIDDNSRPDHFYALIDSYLDFPRPAPFAEGGHYHESALRRGDGDTNKGAFGRAVRQLPDHEYDAILRSAFVTIISAHGPSENAPQITSTGFAEPTAEFERPLIERVVTRPFREAAFSGAIKAAYRDTCAFTGLKIVNGGGRSEVQTGTASAASRGSGASSAISAVASGERLQGVSRRPERMSSRGLFESLARPYHIVVVSTLRRPTKKSDIPQQMMPRQPAPAMLALTPRR